MEIPNSFNSPENIDINAKKRVRINILKIDALSYLGMRFGLVVPHDITGYDLSEEKSAEKQAVVLANISARLTDFLEDNLSAAEKNVNKIYLIQERIDKVIEMSEDEIELSIIKKFIDDEKNK